MAPQTLRTWAGIPPVVQIRPAETALLLIDYQREYLDGRLPLTGAAAAIRGAEALMALADGAGIPVIHIHHIAAKSDATLFAPGTTAVEPIPGLEPREGHHRLTKGMPSSFHGTGLDELLRVQGIGCLLIAGFMTHMCVDTTTRDAVHRGYRAVVAGDTCASRPLPGGIDGKTQHRASLAALADRFADVVSVEALERLLTA
ncbi:MAG TPA: cysteine hydrolase family protein [Rhodocyclaceae bacterium]|nr:cysteine hydrolase family protein [Rhodocyclaceae bacterium]